MPVHKLLKGEGAEAFLPFALSRVRALSVFDTPRTERHALDGVLILIQTNPLCHQHHIVIDATGGTVGYEFFTTYGSDFPTRWRATHVRLPNMTLPFKGKKLSSAFNPEGGVLPAAKSNDPLAPAINLQRNAEYFWWPAKTTPDIQNTDAVRTKDFFMSSTLGAVSWQANEYDYENFLGSYVNIDGVTPKVAYFGIDLAADVQPALYEKGKAAAAMPDPTMPNWPRRAACMTVGNRRFVIMTDMQSNFYAFPASYLNNKLTETLFHPSRAKKVTPPEYMPDVVAKPSVSTMSRFIRGPAVEWGASGLRFLYAEQAAPITTPGQWHYAEPGVVPGKDVQRHHYLWDFNGTATKACAVVHTHRNGGHENLTVVTGGGTVVAKGMTEYGPQYRPSFENEWTDAAGGTTPIEVHQRAVLEVEFHITVTGPGEDDFTFEVTTSRLIEDGWYFDAAYAYRDARLVAKSVDPDALLTDELRLYGQQADVPTGGGGDTSVVDAWIVTKNQDRNIDVAYFTVAWNAGFTMSDGFFFVSTAGGSFPGSPPTMWRWSLTPTYVTAPADWLLSKLVASDLKSMSKVLHVIGNPDPLGLHVVVFGETRQDKGLANKVPADSLNQRLPTTFVARGSAWFGGPATAGMADNDRMIAYPLALHRLLWRQSCVSMGMLEDVQATIATHPDGHFAVFAHYLGAPEVFDLIEYRFVEKSGTENVEHFYQTTHLAMLAQAHGVSVDMENYRSLLATPDRTVVQRFAAWRNIKLSKVKWLDVGGLNPRLATPI